VEAERAPAVNAADVGQTRSHSGAATDPSNFRSDINVNGIITATDVSQVKASSGTVIP